MRGFRVGQIIVHSAAAFERARPRAGRDLFDRSRDQGLADAVFVGPQPKRQRKGVNANRGARGGPRFDHARIRAGRKKHRQVQIVGRLQQAVVMRGQLLSDAGDLGRTDPRVESDRFERLPETPQMAFQTKQLAAERAQLLGDGGTEHKTGIRNRDAGLRTRDKPAVEIRLSFIHEVDVSRKRIMAERQLRPRRRVLFRKDRESVAGSAEHEARSCRSASRKKC